MFLLFSCGKISKHAIVTLILAPHTFCIFVVLDWENVEPQNRNVDFASGEFDVFGVLVRRNKQKRNRNVDLCPTHACISFVFNWENAEPPNRNVDSVVYVSTLRF